MGLGSLKSVSKEIEGRSKDVLSPVQEGCDAMSFDKAASALCELRVAELVSVDSEIALAERLSLRLPSVKSKNPQGALQYSSVVPPLLARATPDAFPFRFLDARALGSEKESVGLSINTAAESELAMAVAVRAWQAALPYAGISKTEAAVASEALNALCFIGCVGDYGRWVFLSSDDSWPAIGILDSELIALGAFYPEDIELSWDNIESLLMWYVSDVPANTGSSWRYVDSRHRQFRIERVY